MVFLDGFFTGLILQLAIGPVGLFIGNIALQHTMLDALAGVIAVTLVDYLYITLAIAGAGTLLERPNIKRKFGMLSAFVLIIFGMIMMKSTIGVGFSSPPIPTSTAGIVSSFSSVFLLTITSPMTIVFWTSIFALKAVERGYARRELVVFGLSAGLATLVFMGSAVVLLSLVRQSVPEMLIRLLNVFVGCLLALYGGVRLIRIRAIRS